jgi:hypothetical protein
VSSTVDDSRDLGEELDQRVSAGFEISLLWLRRDDNLIVSIEDRKTGESFELPVSSEEALEVFNHPFAYVAAREAGSSEAARAGPSGRRENAVDRDSRSTYNEAALALHTDRGGRDEAAAREPAAWARWG